MLEVFAYLITVAATLAIGVRLGRRREPRIVGDWNVPMVVAIGQRVMLGGHDMTVANIVVNISGPRGPRTASLDFVDSAEWEKKRRIG